MWPKKNNNVNNHQTENPHNSVKGLDDTLKTKPKQ